MTKGPAKIKVRVDGEDSDATADEALALYVRLTAETEKLEPAPEGK